MAYPEIVSAEVCRIRQDYEMQPGDAERAVDALLRGIDYDDDGVPDVVEIMKRVARDYLDMREHDCASRGVAW